MASGGVNIEINGEKTILSQPGINCYKHFQCRSFLPSACGGGGIVLGANVIGDGGGSMSLLRRVLYP